MNLIKNIIPIKIITKLVILNANNASKGSGIKIENRSDKKKLNPTKIEIKYNRGCCRKYAAKHKGTVINNNPVINPCIYTGKIDHKAGFINRII